MDASRKGQVMKIKDEFSGTLTLMENSTKELVRVLKEQDEKFINDVLDGKYGFTLKSVDGRSVELIPADRPQGWIPCSERLPSSSGKCLVTEGAEQKTTSIGYYSAEHKRFYSAMDVIAWMLLPKPYGEREGE